jgi:hypothetical protein
MAAALVSALAYADDALSFGDIAEATIAAEAAQEAERLARLETWIADADRFLLRVEALNVAGAKRLTPRGVRELREYTARLRALGGRVADFRGTTVQKAVDYMFDELLEAALLMQCPGRAAELDAEAREAPST